MRGAVRATIVCKYDLNAPDLAFVMLAIATSK